MITLPRWIREAVVPVGLTVLAGCSGMHIESLPQLLPAICALPEGLSDSDQEKLQKFSEKVSSIVKKTASDQLAADVHKLATEAFSANQQAKRTLALGHAACIACRMDALNVMACAQALGQVISSLTPSTRGAPEPPEVQAANHYSETMLRGMLPPE